MAWHDTGWLGKTTHNSAWHCANQDDEAQARKTLHTIGLQNKTWNERAQYSITMHQIKGESASERAQET